MKYLVLASLMVIGGVIRPENIADIKDGKRYPSYPNAGLGVAKIMLGLFLLGHIGTVIYDIRERNIEMQEIMELNRNGLLPLDLGSRYGTDHSVIGFSYRLFNLIPLIMGTFVLLYEGTMEISESSNKKAKEVEASKWLKMPSWKKS
jgi:hypothetical protein